MAPGQGDNPTHFLFVPPLLRTPHSAPTGNRAESWKPVVGWVVLPGVALGSGQQKKIQKKPEGQQIAQNNRILDDPKEPRSTFSIILSVLLRRSGEIGDGTIGEVGCGFVVSRRRHGPQHPSRGHGQTGTPGWPRATRRDNDLRPANSVAWLAAGPQRRTPSSTSHPSIRKISLQRLKNDRGGKERNEDKTMQKRKRTKK